MCVHQRATFVELSELDGCEPQLFGQIHHGSDRIFIVACQKDDPVTSLDLWIGRELGRTQVIEALYELGAGGMTSPRRRRKGGRPVPQAG